MSPPLLELRRLAKAFGGIPALRPLSLELAAGEVLGIVGENGAGKSTLIKLLSGVHHPDAGEIVWDGRPMHFASPHEALSAGIATIHQELAFCGHLSVAENLFLGEAWPRTRWGAVNWPRLFAQSRERLASFTLELDPAAPVHSLSAAQRQEVAISRALSREARLLILDEPSASLSEPDVQRLFGHLRRLRTEGVALIYVSHRLDEVLALTDRIAVLRDGELVASYPANAVDAARLVRDMVGRPIEQIYPHTRSGKRADSIEPLLELEEATHDGLFADISFALRPGEIVGLAGLIGAGRSEVARAIYGLYPLTGGTMKLRGQTWHPPSPKEALRAGVAYLPEERKRQGLVLDHPVDESISIGFSDRLSHWGMIPEEPERARIAAALRRFDVRVRDPHQAVGTLSGGNQQKAMLARWLERDPDVIVLDEPTRGVDVGAKADIHALIDRLAADGKAVLLISSDLPEVLGLSDRVLVMHEGRITAELSGAEKTQENVLHAAAGEQGGRGAGEKWSQGEENAGAIDAPALTFSPAHFLPGVSSATAKAETRTTARSAPLTRSLRRRLLFLAVGNIALLLLIFSLLKPGSSFTAVLARAGPDMAPTLIAGLGLTGVICTGAIDLSIASIIAVAGTVFGLMVRSHQPAILCFAAVLVTTTLLSAANGWLINRLRLPAIIITLGGLAFYRGLALIAAEAGQPGFPGYFAVPAGSYQSPGKDFPTLLLAATLAAAVAFEFMARTPRHWLALGSDEEAVRLAGLSPSRIRQGAFWFSGLFLGVAALIHLTRVTAIEPSRIALGFELSVIGAVILGGTNIFGGEGSYLGTALGACFLHFVGEALIFAGVSPYWREVFTGGVILAVIGLDCALHRRRKLMEELA